MSEQKGYGKCRWCGKRRFGHILWIYCFDTNDSTRFEPVPAVPKPVNTPLEKLAEREMSDFDKNYPW